MRSDTELSPDIVETPLKINSITQVHTQLSKIMGKAKVVENTQTDGYVNDKH